MDSLLHTRVDYLSTINKKEGFMNDFFSFKRMVSKDLIKIAYIIGLIAISLSGILAMVGGSQLDRKIGSDGLGVMGVLIGLAILIFGNLIWRVFCERIIIWYSINDTLTDILKALEKQKTAGRSSDDNLL